MKTAIVIFFLLLLLTALVLLGYFFMQYRSWPPYQWALRLRSQINQYHQAIAQVDNDPAAKQEHELRDRRIKSYLDSIPMIRLADYPGIGEGIVQKLTDANFTKIDQMRQLNWWASVPGIGEVRIKQLNAAAKAILTDAETRFDNGQCQEGQAFLAERETLRDGHREESLKRDRIKHAANRAIREAQPLVDLANAVNFTSFLLHRNDTPVTADIMARPFPQMVIDETPVVKMEVPKTAPPVSSSTPPASPPTPEKELPKDDTAIERLRIYCRFGFVIARADGRVAVAEKKMIRQFLVDCFSGDGRVVRHIDPIIEQCENPPPAESDVIAEILELTNAHEREELMTIARKIADSGGDRNQKEQKLLDRIAASLGIGGAEPQSTPVATTASDPREILGIPPKAELSAELIRRRFNILTDQFDPIKAQAMGAEFVTMAEQKRAAVKMAAEALLKSIGESLTPPASPPPPPPSNDMRHNPDLDAIFGS